MKQSKWSCDKDLEYKIEEKIGGTTSIVIYVPIISSDLKIDEIRQTDHNSV